MITEGMPTISLSIPNLSWTDWQVTEDMEADEQCSTTATLERDSPISEDFYSLSRDAKLFRASQIRK
jgi:hypothetical protein